MTINNSMDNSNNQKSDSVENLSNIGNNNKLENEQEIKKELNNEPINSTYSKETKDKDINETKDINKITDNKEVKDIKLVKSEKKLNNIIIEDDSSDENKDKQNNKEKNKEDKPKTNTKSSDKKINNKTMVFPYKIYPDDKNNSTDDDEGDKNSNPFGSIDPLSFLFANILNSMTNPNATSDIKLVPTFIEFGIQDSNNNESNDDENKKEEVPIKFERRFRSNTDLNDNDMKKELGTNDDKKDNDKKITSDDSNQSNSNNKMNKKQSHKIDFASTVGDINYLNNWLKENLDESNIFNGNINEYSSDSIDHASSNGKINILEWWLKAYNENKLPLKYSTKAINLASRNGKINTLDWWLNSGLELKYDNDSIDYASNGCRIDVLNWWINNYTNGKVKFEYSTGSIDNAKLDEERLLKLVKWWKEQKDKNDIEFKYTKEFISYLDSWSYTNVHKYLMDNSMIKSTDKLSSKDTRDKNPVIGLFELLGTPMGMRRSKETSQSKVDISKLPEDIQKHIKEKEEELNNNMLVNGKAKEYIDNLVKIPFGKYKNENIFKFIPDLIAKINSMNLKHKNKSMNKVIISNESDLISFFGKIEYNMEDDYAKYLEVYKKFIDIRVKYIEYVNQVLENTIYGQVDTKKHIKCIIAQWLSGGLNKGVVIGVQGPPGVGKTTVIKGALSKCLVNFITYNLDRYEPSITINEEHNDYRPFCFMSLGGTTNGSTLSGHNITYHGATSGDIVKHLKEAGVMNPILYFDELDKISNTEHGHEISSVLTHITDPAQNEHFTDRYFSEVKIDLSKCIIIFSYNDTSKIDRILLDRIQEIRVDAIKHLEKIEICKKFLIPEICKNIGYNPEDFIFSDDKLSTVILEYTHEAGVRKLKEKLQDIVRSKHLERIENKSTNTKSKIMKKFIHDTFADYPKIHYKKIKDEPRIGYINGMYATATGIGGITVIQVKRIYHKDVLGIQITGSVEKVMSESIQVAKTVAYNLLTRNQQKNIAEDFKDTGLHVHCPEGATPKDGPSAGAAITSAIYSVLVDKPIRHDIAITGEIDLDGNVTMIGGLDAKLSGAKRAGVRLALVPKENMRDIEIIKRKNPTLIDDEFAVKLVSRIEEVIKIVF